MRGRGLSYLSVALRDGIARYTVHDKRFGLDQINTAVLPRTLAGKGLVNLELTVDGKPANVVTLNFK